MLGFAPLSTLTFADDFFTEITGALRRAVHVSASSVTIAVVTDGENSCILSDNTPNRVDVTSPNGAT